MNSYAKPFGALCEVSPARHERRRLRVSGIAQVPALPLTAVTEAPPWIADYEHN